MLVSVSVQECTFFFSCKHELENSPCSFASAIPLLLNDVSSLNLKYLVQMFDVELKRWVAHSSLAFLNRQSFTPGDVFVPAVAIYILLLMGLLRK